VNDKGDDSVCLSRGNQLNCLFACRFANQIELEIKEHDEKTGDTRNVDVNKIVLFQKRVTATYTRELLFC